MMRSSDMDLDTSKFQHLEKNFKYCAMWSFHPRSVNILCCRSVDSSSKEYLVARYSLSKGLSE
jgi:hypothetical protein